jgi:RsiW-degrading membrane proteinase PrsW (M82 family)
MVILIGLFVSLAAAIIPTILWALAFYLADRYEREPVWMVVVAFLWGAIPAIVASLIGEILIGAPMVNAPGSVAEAVVESALVAPLVEEFAKGLALFLIYRLFRHEFDGVLDGLTYGALIGFGFAMTENFFYFVGAFTEGGFVDLSLLIFLRALIFGLNHAFYTGLLGIGFGLARHARTGAAQRGWIFAGFAAAVLTHAVHNLGASISSINGLGILLSLFMAIMGVALIGLALILAWRQERRWLREELREEVGVMLTPAEYESLTRNWRRSPLLDYRKNAAQARRLRLVVKLAFRKHRLHKLGPRREPQLVAQIEQLRGQILASAAGTG